MKEKLIVLLIAFVFFLGFEPVLAEEEKATRTVQDEIIYNVFVDRFNNGDAKRHEQVDIHDELAYHGGDIRGVNMRLDVLESLGFTTVMLSPIMENAKKGYHGYWIEDFFEVEEQFGDKKELEKLIEKAHERDMKVVLELVTNYVAPSFLEKESKADKSWFKESKIKPIAGNVWMEDVLTFDQSNEAVQDYLIEVATYWMDNFDIDGYKLHAADEADQAFIRKLTETIKEKDENFYILAGSLQGEGDLKPLIENQAIDAVDDVALFEQYNEVLTHPDKSVKPIYETWAEEKGDKRALYVDNINTARFSNNFADNKRNSITTWGLTLASLYTTPGVPVIYQGSETPMYGPGYPENRYMVDFTSSDQDLEKVFEKIATIRENFPALVHGDYEFVAEEEGLSLYKRSLKDETLYIAINNDTESRVVTMDELSDDYQLNGLIQDHIVRKDEESGLFEIGLPRETAEIFVVEDNTGFNWFFIGFVASVFIVFIYFIVRLERQQKKRLKENQ